MRFLGFKTDAKTKNKKSNNFIKDFEINRNQNKKGNFLSIIRNQNDSKNEFMK